VINDSFKSVTGMTWDEAVHKNNQLFFEADELDNSAYALLHSDTLCPETWQQFSQAKQKAESKYLEARHEWQRIKLILGSLERAKSPSVKHAQPH